jgi:AcrR family transcriptional regulator
VLQAALELADESGIESLTMRRLAERLGVEAMSLYNHVRDKDAMLAGIVDLVINEVALPSPDEDWEVAVKRCALSAHEVLLRHRWACSLVMTPPSGGALDSRLRYIEALLRRFRQAGFSPALTYRAYHAVDSHILGFTMWEIGHGVVGSLDPDIEKELLALVSSGDFPYLLEHAQEHFAGHDDDPSEFEFGLDLVLEGLRRLHATETREDRATGTKQRRDPSALPGVVVQ